MNKTLWILVAVVVLGGAGLWLFTMPHGINVGGLEFGGTERSWLADRSIDFLEDIQFKDFDKASTYHLHETQKARDIPAMIQRAFRIRHEVLDIMRYEILEVDLDRSKTRARVRTLIDFKGLGDKKLRDNPDAHRDLELLLYWFKKPGKNGELEWFMELESSLR